HSFGGVPGAQVGVLGLVDNTHAAASERLQHVVVGDDLTDRDGARMAAVCAGLRRFCLSLLQPEGLAAGRAGNLHRRVTFGSLDQTLAMGTGEVHGTNSCGAPGGSSSIALNSRFVSRAAAERVTARWRRGCGSRRSSRGSLLPRVRLLTTSPRRGD